MIAHELVFLLSYMLMSLCRWMGGGWRLALIFFIVLLVVQLARFDFFFNQSASGVIPQQATQLRPTIVVANNNDFRTRCYCFRDRHLTI
jgi:hypothetical protein